MALPCAVQSQFCHFTQDVFTCSTSAGLPPAVGDENSLAKSTGRYITFLFGPKESAAGLLACLACLACLAAWRLVLDGPNWRTTPSSCLQRHLSSPEDIMSKHDNGAAVRDHGRLGQHNEWPRPKRLFWASRIQAGAQVRIRADLLPPSANITE